LLDILSSFLTFKGNPFEFSKYYKDGGIRYADFYDISTKQLERMKDYDYLKGLDFCVIY